MFFSNSDSANGFHFSLLLLETWEDEFLLFKSLFWIVLTKFILSLVSGISELSSISLKKSNVGMLSFALLVSETLPLFLNISVDFFSFLIFSLALSNIDLLLVSLKTSLNDLFLASTCDLLNKSSIFKVSFLLSALLLTSLKLICFFSVSIFENISPNVFPLLFFFSIRTPLNLFFD